MTKQFMARIGGESAVFPSIVVRYSMGTYRATARWNGIRARGECSEYQSRYTSSEAAVRAAWIAHTRLFEKVCTPHSGEDAEFWTRQAQRHNDIDSYVAVVTESTDSKGGYVVHFLDRTDVIRP